MRVTIIEAQQILSSFDDRLQRYAEKKISQRKQMQIIQDSVTGSVYVYVYIFIT